MSFLHVRCERFLEHHRQSVSNSITTMTGRVGVTKRQIKEGEDIRLQKKQSLTMSFKLFFFLECLLIQFFTDELYSFRVMLCEIWSSRNDPFTRDSCSASCTGCWYVVTRRAGDLQCRLFFHTWTEHRRSKITLAKRKWTNNWQRISIVKRIY